MHEIFVISAIAGEFGVEGRQQITAFTECDHRLSEGQAAIGCRMREQRIWNARNDLDGGFVRRRREEFCNDLAKKKKGASVGADDENAEVESVCKNCLTGARMKIPLNGIWESRMPLLTSSGVSNDSTYGSITPITGLSSLYKKRRESVPRRNALAIPSRSSQSSPRRRRGAPVLLSLDWTRLGRGVSRRRRCPRPIWS